MFLTIFRSYTWTDTQKTRESLRLIHVQSETYQGMIHHLLRRICLIALRNQNKLISLCVKMHICLEQVGKWLWFI
jgi:hypothetical protein